MSKKKMSQVANRWVPRPTTCAALIGAGGVVAGVLLTIAGQYLLSQQTIEYQRENRLWSERVAAYSAFDLASYELMRVARFSDPEEVKKAQDRVREGLGPISIFGSKPVAEAAAEVHLFGTLKFAEEPSKQQIDDLSATRINFKNAVRMELRVVE
jgi:hypothetical protein